MLQDILFGVNIIKGAFFKGENELEEEIASAKEIKDNIGKRDNQLDSFIQEFNQGQSDYPVKSKIIRKDN